MELGEPTEIRIVPDIIFMQRFKGTGVFTQCSAKTLAHCSAKTGDVKVSRFDGCMSLAYLVQQ
jgi:phosphotransferase system IIA component